ncbi:FAD binding domain-containing protein [Aspergillus tetrazonus]
MGPRLLRARGKDLLDGMTVNNSPELVKLLHALIGDDSVEIEILAVDPWTVRESVAEEYRYSRENIFLLGDAAHRHPPAFGLGLNTAIQDAYNLAWKVAYVSKSLAGPEQLGSYSAERQPVGAVLVRESNNGIRAHARMWEALGMPASTGDEGAKQLARIAEASPDGAASRLKIREALGEIEVELQSLGIAPPLEGNPITTPQISTFPGSRLPHARLDIKTRRKVISTLDLAGKASFCVLFGVGGEPWREAAVNIGRPTGIPINAYGIGYALDYADIYREWHSERGFEEDGCVLIRPDRFVAWGSRTMVEDCEAQLRAVLRRILRRDQR